jgi:hypothetical protein
MYQILCVCVILRLLLVACLLAEMNLGMCLRCTRQWFYALAFLFFRYWNGAVLLPVRESVKWFV